MNTSTSTRREFLRTGLAAIGGVTLPGLMRLRAATGGAAANTAVILVWLRGGASHLETYDPKPDAPSEFRGPYSARATKTVGLRVGELLPRHAALSNRFTIVRSMAHTGGGHPAGSLQLLSGDTDGRDKLQPIYPDFMSVVNRLRAGSPRRLPNYVGVNPVVNYDNFTIAGPAYLGEACGPFAVTGDPSAPGFRVPNITPSIDGGAPRLGGRIDLRRQLDTVRRNLGRPGAFESMDRFEAQALDLLTSPEAARAFDLNLESDRVRERYGRNQWGQQLLMARRLVEAGVEVVTSTLDGPLCGRVANWDDHAVNHHVFDALKYRAPYFDQAVTALIEDVFARGLDRRVLVVVTGEFGRTPRISYVASSGGGTASAAAGTVQPGRDHWPAANSMLFAGGGIPGGRVIGATDKRGEEVIDTRVGPQDFLATIYRHLGIDYDRVALPDFTGRPVPIVNDGRPVPGLFSGGS